MLRDRKNLKDLEFAAVLQFGVQAARLRCTSAEQNSLGFVNLDKSGNSTHEQLSISFMSSREVGFDRVMCGLLHAAYGEQFTGYRHDYWMQCG
jgi:hypothetical protein